MNAFLYLNTVLIWGTTWIAIHWQMGDVPVLASVFYRFAIAAVLLLPLLYISRQVQATTRKDHGFMMLQGVCLFSLNFVCFYTASLTIASGLLSVIFSAATLFNAFNSRLFWGERPSSEVFFAGVLGVCGLGLMFWPELSRNGFSLTDLKGIGLAMLGTYLFSLGNMISIRHSKRGLKPLTSNAYAMIYGALFLAGLLVITRTPLMWDSAPRYVGSLFYLAIVGTIIGFTAYLSLVGRIGANKAAYATVMFPVVALSLSTIFEGYQWSLSSVVGLLLVFSGNGLILGVRLPGLGLLRKIIKASPAPD
ncbi:DMT family transporter [Neptunomonas antarctica]|uniref:Permease of the drug/metabolite transporter (DMT) superfamily n=1 Tax=Neptunomonas antarctica TaxID=619304 RepID=A0A1N7IU36_9GAMM|nr:DMT family transporter [Neptunomonas antarctica]SIS40481.1 Permease of the drug/metabolite transporter (DMT) superfamily [Neptunomonas antarctica]